MLKLNHIYSERIRKRNHPDPNEVGFNQQGLSYVLYQRIRDNDVNALLFVCSASSEVRTEKLINQIRTHDQRTFENMY